jgi:nitrogen fixation-related uncharacterized protein
MIHTLFEIIGSVNFKSVLKKMLKIFIVLAILMAIIAGVGFYYTMKADKKYELERQELITERLNFDSKLDWILLDKSHTEAGRTITHNRVGEFQMAVDDEKLYYRHVELDSDPPVVAYYSLNPNLEGWNLEVTIRWFESCTKGASVKFVSGSVLKCSDDETYLFTSVNFEDMKIGVFDSLNLGGVYYSYDAEYFNLNELVKNHTLRALRK